MKYIIMLQYRAIVSRKVVQMAHHEVFETAAEAEPVLFELCNKHSAMGWLVEMEIPAFRPPLKSVKS